MEIDRPAIAKLGPHILEVSVTHVLDGEDEAVLVLVDALADGAEELDCVLFAFLFGFREVHDFGALGTWHCERVC